MNQVSQRRSWCPPWVVLDRKSGKILWQRAAAHVDRLLPALELLRTAPAEPISLEHAARLCRLSPSYFCRRFRQLFDMTFTDYARTYRLHLAARRLATSGGSISAIV